MKFKNAAFIFIVILLAVFSVTLGGVPRHLFAAGHGCPQNEPDRDGDGVPDREDDFPDDPTRFKDEDPFGDKKFDEMDQKDFEDYYWQHLLNPYFRGLDWLIPGGIPSNPSPSSNKALPQDLNRPDIRIDGRAARMPLPPPIFNPGPIQNPLPPLPPDPVPPPKPNLPPKPKVPRPKTEADRRAEANLKELKRQVGTYFSGYDNQVKMLRQLEGTPRFDDALARMRDGMAKDLENDAINNLPEGRVKNLMKILRFLREFTSSIGSMDGNPFEDAMYQKLGERLRQIQEQQRGRPKQ